MGIYAKSIRNKPSGSFYIHDVESSAMRTFGDLENDGLIEIFDNSYIGVYVKDATLANQETGEIRLINNGNNAIHLDLASLENSGHLFFNNNAGWSVDASASSDSDNKANGVITGDGIIRGGDFFDNGTINPGDTIGSLEIFGYKPTMPTYNMEIVGPDSAGASDGYDLLIFKFSNTDTLQGTVNITFLGEYAGISKDTFNMFSIPFGYTGSFTSIKFPALPLGLLWETIYEIDGVKFAVDGTITWTGTTSEDWNEPLNWDRNIVPNELNDVIIPNGTTYSAHVNSEPIIKSLFVMPGANLVILQALTVKP